MKRLNIKGLNFHTGRRSTNDRSYASTRRATPSRVDIRMFGKTYERCTTDTKSLRHRRLPFIGGNLQSGNLQECLALYRRTESSREPCCTRRFQPHSVEPPAGRAQASVGRGIHSNRLAFSTTEPVARPAIRPARPAPSSLLSSAGLPLCPAFPLQRVVL
jgi:hypothetical protein